MTDWKPGQSVRLDTERFYMRSLTVSDATDTYISWWNDAEVQEGLGAKPRGWGKQQAQRHIAKFNNARAFHLGVFAYRARSSYIDRFVRFCCVHEY